MDGLIRMSRPSGRSRSSRHSRGAGTWGRLKSTPRASAEWDDRHNRRSETPMAVKLHRCPSIFIKMKGHPCWRVQKALDDQGIDYDVVKGPWPGRKNRTDVIEGTG